MTLEKLAEQIFNECAKDGEPVTMEDALEMAQWEIGSKEVKHNAKSLENKPKADKKPKTVKISEEKIELFQTILKNLDRCEGVERENIEILTENKLIRVKIGDKSFKIDIIQERNK